VFIRFKQALREANEPKVPASGDTKVVKLKNLAMPQPAPRLPDVLAKVPSCAVVAASCDAVEAEASVMLQMLHGQSHRSPSQVASSQAESSFQVEYTAFHTQGMVLVLLAVVVEGAVHIGVALQSLTQNKQHI